MTSARATIIRSWWEVNVNNRDSGRAKALAARLRRAGPIEALAEPEVHQLAQQLRIGPARADVLSCLVRLLAHVRGHQTRSLAEVLGGREPALSPLRFQRLMRARGEEFVVQARRALAMTEGGCNVGRFGTDLLDWEHPERGDVVRARWCFEYFGAPAPAAEGEATAQASEETSP